jgi:GTP cyclohydrolase I
MYNGNGKAELAELAELTVAPRIAVNSALGGAPRVVPLGQREALKPADNLQAIIKLLLSELGVDASGQHFRDTPVRVARFFREYTRGYRLHPKEILKTFSSRNKGLIVISDIEFFSLCPHHLLVYGGKVHFGYIPDGRIVGISKIPRLVQGLAARMVVQEDLVADVADAFMSVVKPLGCLVKATGKHDCVAARGVRCREATITTLALRGLFEENAKLVEEFHQSISHAGSCIR